MAKKLITDTKRGILTLKRLIKAYNDKKFFNLKKLPEEILPEGVEKGTNTHLLFLTLVSSIGYLRKEELLWTAARETYEEDDLRYLFFPDQILNHPLEKIERDLKEYSLLLSLKSIKNDKIKFKSVDRRTIKENDLAIWLNMSNLLKTHNSDVVKLLKAYDMDALKLIDVFTQPPLEECFPNYQRKEKIIIWLLRLKEDENLPIINFDKIPMPVNYHVIRATCFSGSVTGIANSIESDLTKLVAEYWFEMIKDKDYDLDLNPIEFERYLWLLSKFGCSPGRQGYNCNLKNECPIGDFCSKGEIKILNTYMTIDIVQTKTKENNLEED